jgi:hypothetical protein
MANRLYSEGAPLAPGNDPARSVTLMTGEGILHRQIVKSEIRNRKSAIEDFYSKLIQV